MKVNNIIAFFILLFSVAVYSQSDSERVLHFKVIADSASVEGINVINLVNESTAITRQDGSFSIRAKVDDLLVLTAVNFEYKRKIIDSDDLKLDVILIKMTPKITQLEEVIVKEKSTITAESLGIVPKGQKVYTAAERKLYAAQSGPVDIIANLITGRTKQLKKELEVSKKETLLSKTEYLYDDRYYIETLKIPALYIKGFQYFIIEDAEFVAALKAKNKTLTMFHVTRLARQYNSLKQNGQ